MSTDINDQGNGDAKANEKKIRWLNDPMV